MGIVMPPAGAGLILAIGVWVALPAMLLLRRDLAHMLGQSRRIAAGVTLVLVGAAGVMVAAWIGPPLLRWSLATLGFALGGWLLYRRRADHGRAAGLPPGRLMPLDHLDQVDDRHLLRQAGRYGPVYKTTLGWAPAVCVVGLDRIAEVLRTHRPRLSRGALRFSHLIPGGYLRYTTPERHAQYRPLLGRLLSGSPAARSRVLMAAETRALLGCWSEAQVDVRLVEDMPPAMVRVFLTLFFGIARDDPAMARFEALYRTLDCRRLSAARMPEAARAMDELVARVRTAGEGATPERPCYLADVLADDPSLLRDDTFIGNAVAVTYLGAYDFASLMTWVWKFLADDRRWWDRLVAERQQARADEPSPLAERIVCETLRLEQSEYIKRTATEPLTIDGFTVPAGWGVHMCLRESHQDSVYFESPGRFDPDRFLGCSGRIPGYAPFGVGPTRCLAQRLTLILANAVLCELAAGFDWTVAGDGPRVHDGIHWTPSPRFAVRLTAAAAHQPARRPSGRSSLG